MKSDGTSSTWYPIVYFPSKSPFAKPDVNKVAQLSALASTPGPGYDALMSAINKYVGANLTSVPPITGYNASDQGPSKRRSMQNSASGLPYCQDLPGVPCGIMFNIRNRSDGSKYAVLKMTTFTNVDFSSHILPAWSTLVKWAVGNKTDSLIIDLLGNGGGAVKAAYSFALALFSPDQNASYPFINQNDRRVGPAAQYFLNNDLNLDNINRTLQTLLSNRTWVSNRVAALNTSTDILYSLLSSTTAMINAVSILINDNANAAPCVSPDGAAYAGQSCSLFWKYKNFPQLNSLYDNFENSTRVDEELLTAFIVGLVEAAAPFLPFNDDAKVGPAGESTKLFNTSTFHSLTRGGVNGVYTQPYYAFTFQGLYRDNNFSSLPQSPFKKIIAITDGRCGSSCDTFSRTAWFAARNKATPTAPSFKYYTFGGTGKMQDIAPTSFQGGNVLGMDSLSPAWAFYGLAYQAAVWLGDESILSLIDKIPAVLPFYPALLGTMGLPSVTQSEVYYSGLYGSGNPQSTIPGEYLLFQPDFYDPSLYLDVGVASASNPKGGSDLPDLYEAASQKF